MSPCAELQGGTTSTTTHLVWVQLALVHWVGVLDDLHLVLSEALPIKPLQTGGTRIKLGKVQGQKFRILVRSPPACERSLPAW